LKYVRICVFFISYHLIIEYMELVVDINNKRLIIYPMRKNICSHNSPKDYTFAY
jgi:hypothetical protein